MTDYKLLYKQKICAIVNSLISEAGSDNKIDTGEVIAELPPDSKMGDYGFPMFPFAKILKKGPPIIAKIVAEKLNEEISSSDEKGRGVKLPNIVNIGPYVNVFLNRGGFANELFSDVQTKIRNKTFGTSTALKNKRIMVEFSSPNTNKPLHLGHLRNDAIGESISRILIACGAGVQKVCIINDRGIHICKSMLAYTLYGNGATPESTHKKSDHFVGDFYVKFHNHEKDDPTLNDKAKEMLLKWEEGDADTVALWKKMNAWTIEGMKQTYLRTGISFDKYYFESETYLRGKEEVEKGLAKGIFKKEEDGSVQADLTGEGLDKKVLLRADGTSLYITQDFGTAILRHDDWPFDKLVYVVGNEQNYHFKVLFILLRRLGFSWAKDLYHLSYGMVNLPDGKMKSREGTVVDADVLIDDLHELALTEIKNKARQEFVGDAEDTAEKIALGALHYYLLQISPSKDMSFDKEESLAFNGNTGPYLQYTCARISSILAKANDGESAKGSVKGELLISDSEWELLKIISRYNETLETAALEMDSSFITTYLYDLSKAFSRFYHDCPILNIKDALGKIDHDLSAARLELCRAVLHTSKCALQLVCIPFLDSM